MKIQGNLATYEFSDLLQWLAQGNKTGILTVSGGGVEYKLGFDHGRIDMSSSSDPKKRLDSYLHGKGVIDDATLARAERLRDATKMMSGQVLVTLGAVSETQLAQALRQKTEEILCELLTWDQGTFEFEGGDRPEATMVPINMEVTKLLLESMHRLDQERSGQQVPEPEPVVETPVAAAPTQSSPDATQAIEGLALAGVLDPEEPPAPAEAAAPAEEIVPEELPPHYAVMTETPGPLRRLLPYALVGVLSLMAATFYVANRDGTAQAADAGPAGEPILFTRTSGPPPTPIEPPAPPAAAPAAQQAVVEAAAASEQTAAEIREAEEALRRRYEEQLAGLRKELEEARRQTQPAAPEPEPELPAESMLRAAVARPAAARATPPTVVEPREPPAVVEPRESPPDSPAAPPSRRPVVPAVESSPPPPPLPEPETAEPPAAAVQKEVATAPEIVKPKLTSRPTPRYPAAAQRVRRGAKLSLRVLIGVDGTVEKVERTGAKAGLGFDRAAEAAAMESVWEPGTRDGEPTPMWAELRFEFIP